MTSLFRSAVNVGFMNDTALVPEGSRLPLCVSVFNIEPSDIDPRLTITLQIAAYNTTSGTVTTKFYYPYCLSVACR